MKNRTDHSQIKKLKLPDGSWTKADNEVQHEIIKFYLLLRTTANHLPTIDPIVCTTGNVLNRSQQMKLIQPMKPEEVTNALIGIEDMKALGVESFNTFFYKKSWTVIGEDVTKVVLQFFETGTLHKPVNCTLVTLIPKVKDPSYVKEFQPISCCSVIYKLISKIITRRLQTVTDSLIGKIQSDFVKGRFISDNIIMSHEFVKGYG
ncbi:hypothetical protein P3S67_021662 [Capsicum chacoense]